MVLVLPDVINLSGGLHVADVGEIQRIGPRKRGLRYQACCAGKIKSGEHGQRLAPLAVLNGQGLQRS